jgi:hypothetical protein
MHKKRTQGRKEKMSLNGKSLNEKGLNEKGLNGKGLNGKGKVDKRMGHALRIVHGLWVSVVEVWR